MMTGLAELSRAAEEARALRPDVGIALATLVKVEGSSYRQPGARLLVDSEARVIAGAISGGCLEGDIAMRACAVCSSGSPEILTYDLQNDLQLIWGFGSACEGIATVLLEPLEVGRAEADWLHRASAMQAARREGAVIVHLGNETESCRGTIGLIDRTSPAWVTPAPDRSCNRASNLLLSVMNELGASVTRELRSIGEFMPSTSVAETVSGEIFVERLVPPVALVLIGAGRGADAFARIGATLGWQVTVVDHRKSLLESLDTSRGSSGSIRSLCMRADDVPRDPAEQVEAGLTFDSRTAVALMTHIFDVDLEWLSRLLGEGLPYVGVLGSRQRASLLLDRLGERHVDVPAEARSSIFAPIGLDLGGENPESIALAAIAEIQAVMNGRPGGMLRDRMNPIHDRTSPTLPSQQKRSSSLSGLPTGAPTTRMEAFNDSCLASQPAEQ